MKNYFFIFFLLCNILNGQSSKRFIYEYKMVPDRNKIDSLVTNYMNLDIQEVSASYFYNSTKFEMDSILKKTGKINNLLGVRRYDQNLNYEIKKNFSENKVIITHYFQVLPFG